MGLWLSWLEHLICNEEVDGSSPSRSTISGTLTLWSCYESNRFHSSVIIRKDYILRIVSLAGYNAKVRSTLKIG